MQNKLYRNKTSAKIAGVCAGIADYFGWEHWVVRILFVTAFIFNASLTLIVYVIGWIALSDKPIKTPDKGHKQLDAEAQDASAQSSEPIGLKTHAWARGESPKEALEQVETQLKEIQVQVQNMEQYVTSSTFQVRQQLKEL